MNNKNEKCQKKQNILNLLNTPINHFELTNLDFENNTIDLLQKLFCEKICFIVQKYVKNQNFQKLNDLFEILKKY